MNETIRKRLLERLQIFDFKEKWKFLQQGRCPACHQKTLWTFTDNPYQLKCNRLNQCGYEANTKTLYPKIFENFSQRVQHDPSPNAIANLYLKEVRGFSLSKLNGLFTQDSYYDQAKKVGSPTVRFRLENGSTWERLIENTQKIGRKAHFKGSYAGYFWRGALDLHQPIKTLWLVEGIFDAIALAHHQIAAVSIMSCNNFPTHLFDLLDKSQTTIMLALDSDLAGKKAIKQITKQIQSLGFHVNAAITDNAYDWNDCHLHHQLGAQHIQTYLHFGALLLAQTVEEKALLIYRQKNLTRFALDFENRLYWANIRITTRANDQDHEQTLEEVHIQCLANCLPEPLYFQQNEITDESWYYFRINFPHHGYPIKNTFTGTQLSSATEFKKRLLSIAAGAVWTGNANQLNRLIEHWLYNIKTVKTIDFIGYLKIHDCYIFNQVAAQNQIVYHLNEEDFYDFKALSIKTLSQSIKLQINPQFDAFDCNWMDDFFLSFGEKGIVALAYWFGTLFAEQLRAKYMSFPFLEIVGEAGAGKSTLIEFLWKLLGRSDYEGFDPTKSTLAARTRNLAQVSNLPIVLIESDRENIDANGTKTIKHFDWDELKTAYNGRSVRARDENAWQ